MTYRVREIFYTLQGEGLLTGTPAVFVRFAGCNLWSGNEEHRQRDADLNRARCPLFCDTDHNSGQQYDTQELAEGVMMASNHEHALPLVVFTGGEPLLQLDRPLLECFRRRLLVTALAIETNGTVMPRLGVRELLDHVCVSPKTPARELAVLTGTELKIVYPACEPEEYREIWGGFEHFFITPEANSDGLNAANMQAAARYCLDHPRWRLSLQTHKIVELP